MRSSVRKLTHRNTRRRYGGIFRYFNTVGKRFSHCLDDHDKHFRCHSHVAAPCRFRRDTGYLRRQHAVGRTRKGHNETVPSSSINGVTALAAVCILE